MSTLLFSQVTITGKVIDEAGVGLPGANVFIKGTTVGAITNMDGEYQISVPDASGAVLVFSFVGYASEEIPVENRTVIDVTLMESIAQLDEVVVTALGLTREAKSLPYARQAVTSEELTEARATNFITGLAGKAAGVQVINAGTPTGSNRVVIRGNSSLTGSNQPLYVVDGIPLDNEQGDASVSVWNAGDDLDYGNPISQINPDDIESIEILKGPNASALYGSRAANGVVLITTKRGKTREGLGVQVNSNTMFVSNVQYPDYQYVYGEGNGMKMARNANALDPETGLPTMGNFYRAFGAPLLGQKVIDYNGEIGEYVAYRDNIREFYQTGVSLTNSISLDKATDRTSVRLSYTNVNSTFTVENWEVQKRHNLTLRATNKITDQVEVDANIMYSHDKVDNRLYQNGSARNPAYQYIYQLPNMSKANLQPYKDEYGNSFSYNRFHNPLWNIYENNNEDLSNRIIGSVSLLWNFTEHLRFRGKAMGDVNLVDGSEFNNSGASYDPDGYYRTFGRQTYNFNYEGLVSYDRSFGDFTLVANLGANAYQYSRHFTDSRISSLLLHDVESLLNSASIPTVNQSDLEKRINSVFGSASVGFRSLIYLDLTARNDWSSSLPKDNNSYFYPSIGTSFVFSELLPANDILSFGKLRASYAQVGNDADPYQVSTNYNYGGNYNGITWTYLERTRNNENLKPELTTSIEFGLQTVFLNNKISFDATYYKASTVNQIVRAQVTPATGFLNQVYNAGEIQNKGWEFTLGARPVTGQFTWSIDANWSTNQSEVVSLIEGVDRFELRRWFNVGVYAEVGQPFGVIRGNAWQRSPDGKPLVKESNGRVVSETDVIIGIAEPDWLAGLRNSFTYKGFNLSFLFDFRYGGDLFAETMNKNSNRGASRQTLYARDDYYFSSVILNESNNERKGIGLYGHDYVDDRVKGAIYEGAYIGVQDPETGEWTAGEPNYIYFNPQQWAYDLDTGDQSRLVYKTTFVKLREVVLGYNLPSSLLTNIPIDGVRVSLVGRNLAILAQKTPKGIDPEAGTTSGNGQGIEFGSFLPTATYGFNVRLSF
jgi:TonB-linked SusC/RagA family outer membrane protein